MIFGAAAARTEGAGVATFTSALRVNSSTARWPTLETRLPTLADTGDPAKRKLAAEKKSKRNRANVIRREVGFIRFILSTFEVLSICIYAVFDSRLERAKKSATGIDGTERAVRD